MTFVVFFFILLIANVIWSEHKLSHERSRQFIERQQWQSKVDTLTEQLLRRDGVPLDLNKSVRQEFTKRLARNMAFKSGWKSDKPEVDVPDDYKKVKG